MEASLKVAVGPGSGIVFSLSEGETKTLGRGPGVDCVLADPKLQPRHLAVMIQGGAFRVIDLGGGSGMSLNGEALPVRQPTEAWSGDTLALGDCELRVTVQGRSSRSVDSRQGGGGLTGAAVLPAAEFEQVREIGKGATGTVCAAFWKTNQC